MKNFFIGTIVEESLEDKAVLSEAKILSTKIVSVKEKHGTPWLKKWTLRKVTVPAEKIELVARKLSKAIDSKHANSWYADFKNDELHYIIFRSKVFVIHKNNEREYEKALQYGIGLGIPSYQLDFC